MITLSQIQHPIKESLKEFDTFIDEQFRTDDPIMGEMLKDALSSRGKGVRSLLVLLSAAMNSGNGFVTKRAYIAAMMVEMIHLSSLIHDDVIDESLVRRSKPSINAKWQSKRAILVGDYILARNISIALSSGQFDLANHIIGTIATLCEGEVIQDNCARRRTITRQEYLDVIAKKTAALISVSASAGAKAAGADANKVLLMREFGRVLGMAFQIQDDILDYDPISESGKEPYQDLYEGKITLPLLIPLEQCSESRREEVLAQVANAAKSEESMQSVIEFISKNDGVKLATEVMQQYINRAMSILSDFPDSEYRTALANLCAFVCARNK